VLERSSSVEFGHYASPHVSFFEKYFQIMMFMNEFLILKFQMIIYNANLT
jgi:hypothetical protein